jgi:hypothetical protein
MCKRRGYRGGMKEFGEERNVEEERKNRRRRIIRAGGRKR